MEILPFLYLGSAYHASRQDYLSDLHITALLNVSRRNMQPSKGHFDYKWIPVEDSHMADISSHFQEAIEFIGELRGIHPVPAFFTLLFCGGLCQKKLDTHSLSGVFTWKEISFSQCLFIM